MIQNQVGKDLKNYMGRFYDKSLLVLQVAKKLLPSEIDELITKMSEDQKRLSNLCAT